MEGNSTGLGVDKESPVPIYHQIASALRTHIMDESLQEGDKLPSENDLAAQFEVSRITLRQALAELEREGIIVKRKGMGAFVSMNPQPLIQELNLPSVLGRKLRREGINLDPEILQSRREGATALAGKALGVSEGTPLVYFERLFLLDGHPIALNRSWLSEARVPGILEDGLIGKHLSVTLAERYDLDPTRIENTIESSHCSPAEMKLLRMNFQASAIVVTATSFDGRDRPIEYSRTLWLGDRVKFRFTIERA